jgi:hypothetical protein
MAERDSMPKNIRAFNWLTLRIFNDLYEAFPEPQDIQGLRFVISTLFDVGTKSKEAEYLTHFTATMRWLKDEGFLRYESDDSGNFRRVVLTLRGLTVLGYTPTSLSLTDRKEPIITKIKRVLSKGTEAAASDTVKAIITKAFELMVS